MKGGECYDKVAVYDSAFVSYLLYSDVCVDSMEKGKELAGLHIHSAAGI